MLHQIDPAAQVAAPTLDDIRAAARRLDGLAVRTPLLESPALNERVGGRVLLKAETLQRTGSFKFRGAYNRISRIPERDRAGGVVAYSSGNHAQGVAARSEEHTSELQYLMRISYAVFCLKKKNTITEETSPNMQINLD